MSLNTALKLWFRARAGPLALAEAEAFARAVSRQHAVPPDAATANSLIRVACRGGGAAPTAAHMVRAEALAAALEAGGATLCWPPFGSDELQKYRH